MMTSAELRRASELLQKNGEDIETCHTVAGEWLDEDDDMRAEVREHYDLARKLRAKADAHGWQPIETAPRDGTEIDVWCWETAPGMEGQGYRVADAWWGEYCNRWRCRGDEEVRWTHEPTHWQPLPPGPEA